MDAQFDPDGREPWAEAAWPPIAAPATASALQRLAALFAAHPGMILGGLALALHLWANAGYDYFSDELYFIVCGQHLAWGYVDQPPLAPLIARIAHELFGDNLLGLRLFPALASAGLAALSTEAARRLGGGQFARWLAGLAVLAAPVLCADGLLLSADTLQPLAWLAASLALMAAIERQRTTTWLMLGAIAGVALLAKYVMAFFLVAAAIGLVSTPQRRVLARPGPWLAAALALLIILPNLLWQQSHGWPFLQLNATAFNARNITYDPLNYLLQQVLIVGPLNAPIWLAGLAGFAFWPRLAAARWLAVAWFALMGLMLLIHGKSYYPAAIYPILLAGGAVVVEAGVRARGVRAAITSATVLGGAALLPFTLPILPVEGFIAYEHALGVKTEHAAVDKQPVGELPPNYAYMFGWREMAAAVGRAYQALPPQDRARAVFFARDYSEAAAVDVFGAPWRLPPAISARNNYFLWGPRGHDGSVVLLLSTAPRPDLLKAYAEMEPATRIGEVGAIRRELLRTYASAEPVARIDSPHAYPFERGLTLWLCRDRKVPFATDWSTLKLYF